MATILAFHAHPDDEVLLNGGTLARLAAEGSRVIIAVASDGYLSAATDEAAHVRLDELRASALELGVARVVHLGYADSGARAAELAGVRVLEATIPRELVAAFFGPLRMLRLVTGYDPQVIRTAGSPRSAITHRVSVRRFASRKRAALAAHKSQVEGQGRSARMFRVLIGLPTPIFGLLLGREWFAEPGAAATTISGDLLQAAPRGRPGSAAPASPGA
jgi:LmbE family N-acetylglucosaminyl deacetylase